MSTAAVSLLAQEETTSEVIDSSISEGVEGLVDLLPVPDELAWLLENLVDPGLIIVLILVVALVLSRLIKRAIRRGVARMKDPDVGPVTRRRRADEDAVTENLRRTQRADALGNVATSLTGGVIWSLAIIMALAQIGVQLGPLIAGAGIAGVALGFGAQDLVKDFLAGVFMLIEDQYGVGDVVDVGEAVGAVEGITLRSTRLRAIDGTLWHVPNGEIRRVGNMTQQHSRALLDIGIGYGADIDAAVEVLERVAIDLSEDPEWAEMFIEAPQVLGVESLGADSVDIRLLVKTVATKQWEIQRELRRRIKYAFDAAGIEIPFAQRTVWLRTETPVALGDGETAVFETPVPDARTRDAAVGAARRGHSERTDDQEAASLPDAPADR